MRLGVRKPLPGSKALYTPSRWGEIYHSLPHDEALGAGSAGPGKTEVLIHEFDRIIATEHDRCYRAIDHPYPLMWGGSVGWGIFLRRTLKELGPTIGRMKRLYLQMDPGCKFVKDSEELSLGFIFSSGFKLQLGHCKDPDDFEQYLGAEFVKICFDELVTFEEEQYDGIRSRKRSDDPVLGNPKNHFLAVRSMSNPVFKRSSAETYHVKNPHWVRDRFVKKEPLGNKTLRMKLKMNDGTIEHYTFIYLPARLDANPNKNFARQFEKDLRTLKPYMRKALLDGRWDAVEGAFFENEWDPDIHVCKPRAIPSTWKRFRAMDWGYKTQGVILWMALDDDDTLWVEREYSFKMQEVPKVAKRIQEIETGLGLWNKAKKRSMIGGPADDQLWERRGESGRSKAEEFSRLGVGWTMADKKSRHRNAERVSARMRNHENGTQTPGLMIFSTCVKTIETLPAILPDPNDIETPQKGGQDHWYDTLSYGVGYASHGSSAIPSVSRERKDRLDDIVDDDDDRPEPVELGQYGYGSM